MLGDDLEAWLAESALMKRTFRGCAIIAGLIEKRFPGEEKSRRQLTISTDLVYDVLRKHQPDHILLRAARADAATGLLDIKRLGEMLSRIRGRIVHKALDHVSPLSVPVLLEIGREMVYGEASEELVAAPEMGERRDHVKVMPRVYDLAFHFDAAGEQLTFRVHSSAATRMLVALYDKAAGAEEKGSLLLKRESGSDGTWTACAAASRSAGGASTPLTRTNEPPCTATYSWTSPADRCHTPFSYVHVTAASAACLDPPPP